MIDFSNIYVERNFRFFFERHYISLIVYALNFVKDRDEVEDIVQDVFLDVWEKGIVFNDEIVFKSYLYKSTRSRCLNCLRHNKVVEESRDILISEKSEDSILAAMIKEEVYQELINEIDRLPERCRIIYNMSRNGIKPREIADELGIAVETVKSQKKIAKRLLRKRLSSLHFFLILFI